MDLNQYKRKLSDVFQINAVTVEKDYFMLTHKPFKTIKMMSKGLFLNGERYFHENELYRLIMDNREKHQFQVVKGDNGTGKSHLIRWIKEHYERDTKDEEAVLFISRMQSTLKGALQQIINAEVIQNHETSRRLKKLIDANEHLDNKHLKNIILAHFMVAVQEDDDTKEITLRQGQKNNLYDFLSSQETRDLFLRENGPVDRIQKKLATDVNNQVMNDVDPHFVPEDFYMTSAQAQELKKTDISRKALRLIGEIQESTHADEQEEVEEFRQKLASYLNQFLDKVVQECLSLRGTDLKDIFTLLRQELKKEGKNLTLFIEDITSFTGVDKDLVEVLITDHKENDSLCRLISIVGITNGYYNTSLPGNIKDRITSEIEIDNVVIQDEDECAELAARYINAVYLKDEQIQEWKNNGYRLEAFPVATAFKEHTWANFTIDQKLELSIFPFTKTALWNFYVHIDPQTPRNFLQTVLLQYIQKYTIDGPNGHFPPPIDKVIADFKRVPNWKDTTTERVLKKEVPEELKDRYETLFRIWGNGTMEKQVIDGKNVVGGLEDDVFEAFALEPVTGIQGTSPPPGITPATTKPSRVVGPGTVGLKHDPPGVKPGTPANEDPKKPERDNPVIKLPVEPDAVQPPIIEVPKNPQLDEALSDIEKWAKGGPLSNSWMINDLMDIIREYIPWDLEGISTLIVKDFFSPNYVKIEGQIKKARVNEENALKFKRSDEFRYALEALAYYRYEGKNSWNVNNAHMLLQSLHSWIESIRDDIISYLKKPFDYEGNDWQMDEYISAAEFYTTALLNGFTGKEKAAEEIFLQLVKDKQKDKLHQHTKPWNTAASFLDQEHTDLLRRFYNEVQGGVKRAGVASPTFFYDAYEIIDTLNKLKASDFDLKIKELKKGSSSWYTSVNILSKLQAEGRLQKAVNEELNHSTRFVQEIQTIIGDKITQESISHTVKEMKGLLDYWREIMEPFPRTFDTLYQNVLDIQKVVEKVNALQILDHSDSEMEQLVALSNNPSLQIQPFYQVLDNYKKMVDEKSAEITPKITKLKAELSSYKGNPLDEVKSELMTIKEFVTELDERSVDHAAK